MLNLFKEINEEGTALKKIYITCLHLNHGGVEMAITSLANAFFEQGYEVEILCTYNLGQPAYELRPEIKITYLTSVSPNREAFLAAVKSKKLFKVLSEGLYALKALYLKKKTMKQAICQIQDGIIISTRNEHSLLLSKYGQKNVKKIAQLHSDHNFDPKLIRDFRTRYGNIDYFALLTPKTMEEIKEFLKGYNTYTQCITIPNFIEETHFEGSIQKRKQVIAAGRLHPDKDFSSLLRIWGNVCKKKSDYIMKIAGEGQLEQELRNQAEQLGISDSVQFMGAIPHDELLQEMAASCCYALTSVSESFSLVLVESMMCGTVPVAFDVRVGPEAILDDGKNGFLISDRNEQMFTDKIIELIENTNLRNQMEEQAKIRAKQFFKEQVLPKWLAILEN